ncbi:hypothetical protein [Halodesulfovibrio sp.]|uniref:hypothetical protein n=1 Tax=Halodesulfovibrio sp. TaxID=1912772 RepID=UPI0025B8227C|nr:hypothetical protein [Halodesulfovibrio sp.]
MDFDSPFDSFRTGSSKALEAAYNITLAHAQKTDKADSPEYFSQMFTSLYETISEVEAKETASTSADTQE